jgi:hypothetical protein
MDTYLLQHTLHCLSKICLHASFFCYFNRKSSGSTALLGDNASHFKQPILIFTIFWGPDECYYRKVSCAITWISTFLLQLAWIHILLQQTLHCLFKICFHGSSFVIFTERAASTALLDDNASPFKQPRVTQEDYM